MTAPATYQSDQYSELASLAYGIAQHIRVNPNDAQARDDPREVSDSLGLPATESRELLAQDANGPH